MHPSMVSCRVAMISPLLLAALAQLAGSSSATIGRTIPSGQLELAIRAHEAAGEREAAAALRRYQQATAAPPPPSMPPSPPQPPPWPPRLRTLAELRLPRSSPFRKYLFLNASSILAAPPAFAQLRFNPPERLGAAVHADQPWEAAYIYSGSAVLQIGASYHLYYQCNAFAPDFTNASASPVLRGMVCLATSTDGVTFVKPSLGIAPWNGSTANNIVLPIQGDKGWPGPPGAAGASANVWRD